MNIKILILTAIVALVLSLFNPVSNSLQEGFWGNVQLKTWTTPEVMKPDGQVRAYQGNIVGAQMQHDFVSVPSFQSMLSPRMGIANGIGTYIRYNPGPHSMSAIPRTPLGDAPSGGNCGGGGKASYGEMFEESYVPSGCNQTAQAPSNWNNQMNAMSVGQMESAMADSSNASVSTLPIGTMDTMNSEGVQGQEVMMQRYMYSLPKSRLYGLADYIRGDLAIVPMTPKCGEGWFNVYPRINIDLNAGAMNAMGGVGNETSQQLAALINVASGGAQTTVGGVNLADVDMTPQYKTNFLDNMRTPVVTAYP